MEYVEKCDEKERTRRRTRRRTKTRTMRTKRRPRRKGARRTRRTRRTRTSRTRQAQGRQNELKRAEDDQHEKDEGDLRAGERATTRTTTRMRWRRDSIPPSDQRRVGGHLENDLLIETCNELVDAIWLLLKLE